MFRNYRICFLSVLLAACLAGCGKKQTMQAAQPAPVESTQSQPEAAPNAEGPKDSAPERQAPAASTDTYDAVVTTRSIDYLNGQVKRKNWGQARLALKQLEGRRLTAEQRQYVDSLKVQIPAR